MHKTFVTGYIYNINEKKINENYDILFHKKKNQLYDPSLMIRMFVKEYFLRIYIPFKNSYALIKKLNRLLLFKKFLDHKKSTP